MIRMNAFFFPGIYIVIDDSLMVTVETSDDDDGKLLLLYWTIYYYLFKLFSVKLSFFVKTNRQSSRG